MTKGYPQTPTHCTIENPDPCFFRDFWSTEGGSLADKV